MPSTSPRATGSRAAPSSSSWTSERGRGAHNLLLGIAVTVRDQPDVPEVDDFVELWGHPAEPTRSDTIWASRRQLAHGRFCFLYTDASNATAERLYARLGYTRVCDSRQFAFA